MENVRVHLSSHLCTTRWHITLMEPVVPIRAPVGDSHSSFSVPL